MTAALSLLLSGWGLAWIALSMRRHAGVVGATGRAASRLRGAGLVLVAMAPVPWAIRYDPAQALVAWSLCVLPAAGLLVALALAFAPQGLSRITAARLACGLRPRSG